MNSEDISDNRFERLYSRLKKRKLLLFCTAAATLVLLEVLTVSFYAQRVKLGKSPKGFFAHFPVGDLFYPGLGRLGDDRALAQPILSGQRFIGDLYAFRTGWNEVLPADALLGWRMGKNIAALHNGQYWYITNDQGFVSIGKTSFHYSEKKPKNIYRIIVLGGSTVMGMGAFTPDENLPAMLKKELESRWGKEVEVINAGVGGYSSGQEALYLISELVHFDPDLVIVYNGWNDQSYNNTLIHKHGATRNTLKSKSHYTNEERLNSSFTLSGSLKHTAQAMFSTLKSLGEQAVDKVALVHLGARLGSKLYSMLKTRLKAQHTTPKSDVKPYSPQSVEEYGRNLDIVIHAARRYDFNLGLFLQPLMGVDEKVLTTEEKSLYRHIDDLEIRKAFYTDARKLYQTLQRKHHRRDTCIADLSRIFKHSMETVYSDTGHLFAAGNQIVATHIAHALERCGIKP